ncbi:MAG: polysaccharide deacetylase family protein [Alphaproteobacteria bacterium]|nr:polysaccharide deacetylase family protein [Alphaproteobacteria bacterium]
MAANPAPLPEDAHSAVILAYHRIDEEAYPESTLGLEQFLEHIHDIEAGGYHVISLPALLEAFESGDPLPLKTLVITFEGAYRSAIEDAAPLLLEKGIPFTVFYASDPLDQSSPGFASWAQLKALSRSPLVTFGVLPSAYEHSGEKTRPELLRVINKARQRYREVFGKEALYFSYPFGEFSPVMKDLVRQQGFTAAVGLQSGAAYGGQDVFELPRFSLSAPFAHAERFRMITQALPLPVEDFEPPSSFLSDGVLSVGFTLPQALAAQGDPPSCFVSGQDKPVIERLGTRIEIRGQTSFTGRARLNCTMRGPANEDGEARWRWLGRLFYTADLPVDIQDDSGFNTPETDELPELQE